VRILNDAQVPNGKIYSMADIVNDAQYLAREMIREVRLKDGTPSRCQAWCPSFLTPRATSIRSGRSWESTPRPCSPPMATVKRKLPA